MRKNNTYWIVSREYAELAEAGGVKNVTTSLANGFQNLGWDVSVFIPLYGCTSVADVSNFDIIENTETNITIDGQKYKVVYAQGYFKGVHIVFIVNTGFTSKMGVYTYTRLEEALYPSCKSGEGHQDASVLSVLFQKAVIMFGILKNQCPDVFHCQDAHTALIPFIVHKNTEFKTFYKHTKFFLTVHNAGNAYRSQIDSIEKACTLLLLDKSEFKGYTIDGKPEPFLLSQHFASYTTVSPWYADELLNASNKNSDTIYEEFSKRKFHITGITNGINYDQYDPTSTRKSKLPFSFNPKSGILEGKYRCREKIIECYQKPMIHNDKQKIDQVSQYGFLHLDDTKNKPVYFSFHGRLVHQKGIDILTEAAEIVLSKSSQARFIIIGHGSKELENLNCELAQKYKGSYIYFNGYDRGLSRLCIAASDFLVLPSFFEPCGLQDFIGQIYGTIPVAHAVGGLQKIIHEKTGFLYYENTATVLSNLLLHLIERKTKNPAFFTDMISYSANYVEDEYSWEKIIESKYIPLFTKIYKKNA